MHRLLRAASGTLLAVPFFTASSLAGQGPPPEVREAVAAVVEFLEAGPDVDALAFARDRFAASYRATFSDDEVLRRHLTTIREAGAGRTGDLAVEAVDDGLRLILEGGTGSRGWS